MPHDEEENRRILLVDDNQAIHEDFHKALLPQIATSARLLDLETELFGGPVRTERARDVVFELTSAHQGRDALALVESSLAARRPFALAFVDIRMPPGWDGIETIERLWRVDPELQVVICSAHSDYTSSDIHNRLGDSDRLLILRKPFDTTEVVQIAHTLTRKWVLQRAQRHRTEELDALVRARTLELEQANRQLVAEMARRERVEAELRLAHKLDSIAQLAAGIAHEINTPMQFIADTVGFLRTSFEDLDLLRGRWRSACPPGDARTELETLEREIDIDYIVTNAPDAFDRARGGLDRIGAIVRAMRMLGKVDGADMRTTDPNTILQAMLDVSQHEYREIADLDLELDALPRIACHASELGQVFLDLIVNACRAIEPVTQRTGARGTIRVRSALDGAAVVVTIEDTGGGMPEQATRRIFDPLATHGLAIARSIVVERHHGSIDVESVVGRGTRFTVRLPARRAA